MKKYKFTENATIGITEQWDNYTLDWEFPHEDGMGTGSIVGSVCEGFGSPKG